MWDLLISNTNSGFLIMFTQNLSGKLYKEKKNGFFIAGWFHEIDIRSYYMDKFSLDEGKYTINNEA